MKRLLAAVLATTALTATPLRAADPAAVVTTYADIAAAAYGDSLTTAQALQAAVAALIAAPSESTLAAARTASDRRPRALSADRGVPLWQCHRR